MNIIWYIFYPLTIGIPIFTYAFFKWPKYALAGLIIAKPIIDVSWDYNIFLNINFLKLYAGLFVILGVIYIIVKRVPILTSRHSAKNSPFHRFSVSPFHFLIILWLIFLGLNVVSIFIISDAYLLLGKVNYFLRILTGFIALIIFAYVFDFEKDKKFVLSIFIIAGIFPILLWLIPVLSGNPIISNDPLRRIMGPYQNFLHFNFHATQTLICCLAYLAITNKHKLRTNNAKGPKLSSASFAVFLRSLRLHFCAFANAYQRFLRSMFSSAFLANFQRFLRLQFLRSLRSIFSFAFLANFQRFLRLHFTVSPFRMMAFIMLFVSIAMVYKCYSKVGWLTLVTILFIWFLVRKKIIQTILIPVIVAVILFVSPFAKDFQKTFDNEINYFVQGSDTKEMVFRGRLNRWEMGMNDFNSLPIINKLFGAKKSIGDPENDYLRVLWDNGIIGFIAFLILLGLTGYLLIRKFAKNKNPVILMGILIFTMFLISGIGSYSMYYPNLQWFMWGMVGFILSKDKIILSTKQ
jgi:hypothetical protein